MDSVALTMNQFLSILNTLSLPPSLPSPPPPQQRVVTSESQHKYAKIIIDLDDINKVEPYNGLSWEPHNMAISILLMGGGGGGGQYYSKCL